MGWGGAFVAAPRAGRLAWGEGPSKFPEIRMEAWSERESCVSCNEAML
jgi:hypothetical protein